MDIGGSRALQVQLGQGGDDDGYQGGEELGLTNPKVPAFKFLQLVMLHHEMMKSKPKHYPADEEVPHNVGEMLWALL